MRSPLIPLAIASLVCAACGGSTPAPEASPGSEAAPSAAADQAKGADADAAAKKKADDEAARQIPTQCAQSGGDGKLCLPPWGFVKRLCQGFHPDVALTLFAKDSPFTRGYLTRDTEAWNASGGVSSSDKMVFDEEVLILAHRAPDTGGMVVSGAGGGYDVLRWDGTCASLMGEEVRLQRPPQPKHAAIPWKSLGEKTREALQADEKVGKVVTERRKECKGATMGSVSLKCEKADKQMSVVIVEFVRNGGTLPAPGPLP